jgi:hypothetical protein
MNGKRLNQIIPQDLQQWNYECCGTNKIARAVGLYSSTEPIFVDRAHPILHRIEYRHEQKNQKIRYRSDSTKTKGKGHKARARERKLNEQ